MPYVLVCNDCVIATGSEFHPLLDMARQHLEEHPGQAAYLGTVDAETARDRPLPPDKVRLLLRFD